MKSQVVRKPVVPVKPEIEKIILELNEHEVRYISAAVLKSNPTEIKKTHVIEYPFGLSGDLLDLVNGL